MLGDAAIDAIAAHPWRFRSPVSCTLLSHMGGAIRRCPNEESAFTGRDVQFTINIKCEVTEPDPDARDGDWVCEWFDAQAPRST